MATTAGHKLALDTMGKCSNAFFSETTNMINAKLYTKNVEFAEEHPMNIHVHLALIIFVVSEKKSFEHFLIGSNVNICIELPMHDHWKVLYQVTVF
jgi:hypothetical protein